MSLSNAFRKYSIMFINFDYQHYLRVLNSVSIIRILQNESNAITNQLSRLHFFHGLNFS